MTDLPVYRWGAWPPHLLTKSQMDAAGFQTGARLPPPAAQVYRSKSPSGIMYLYDRAQGVPKTPITDARRDQLHAAAENARAGRQCPRCGNRNESIGGLCFLCESRASAILWSRRLLEASSFVILDTETSGLTPGYNEIVQIAVIDPAGNTLLDTYVNPVYPERLTERTNGRSASDINGITPDMLTAAPAWPQVAAHLWPLLAGKTTVIYNAEYDISMLVGDCERATLETPTITPKCAMRAYAKFYGDWSDYWGNFRWQPLNGGHTALDDCRATLALIQSMAAADN